MAEAKALTAEEVEEYRTYLCAGARGEYGCTCRCTLDHDDLARLLTHIDSLTSKLAQAERERDEARKSNREMAQELADHRPGKVAAHWVEWEHAECHNCGSDDIIVYTQSDDPKQVYDGDRVACVSCGWPGSIDVDDDLARVDWHDAAKGECLCEHCERYFSTEQAEQAVGVLAKKLTTRGDAIAVPLTNDGVPIQEGGVYWDRNGDPHVATFVDSERKDDTHAQRAVVTCHLRYRDAETCESRGWIGVYSTPEAAKAAVEAAGKDNPR